MSTTEHAHGHTHAPCLLFSPTPLTESAFPLISMINICIKIQVVSALTHAGVMKLTWSQEY